VLLIFTLVLVVLFDYGVDVDIVTGFVIGYAVTVEYSGNCSAVGYVVGYDDIYIVVGVGGVDVAGSVIVVYVGVDVAAVMLVLVL